MGLMVRKIDGPKWLKYDIANGIDAVSADLITKDLKTESNALSLWSPDDDSDSCIEDAVLALACSSKSKSIDSIDIVKINREAIESKGLSLIQNEGDTCHRGYKNKHYDLIDLTYKSLGHFSELIIENKASIKRIKKDKLKSIIKDGIDAKKIIKEELDSHLLKSLYPAVDTKPSPGL
jgi:hypothetical protein